MTTNRPLRNAIMTVLVTTATVITSLASPVSAHHTLDLMRRDQGIVLDLDGCLVEAHYAGAGNPEGSHGHVDWMSVGAVTQSSNCGGVYVRIGYWNDSGMRYRSDKNTADGRGVLAQRDVNGINSPRYVQVCGWRDGHYNDRECTDRVTIARDSFA